MGWWVDIWSTCFHLVLLTLPILSWVCPLKKKLYLSRCRTRVEKTRPLHVSCEKLKEKQKIIQKAHYES